MYIVSRSDYVRRLSRWSRSSSLAVKIVLYAFLWFAGAVCIVLVSAHVYVQVRHIAHCLLHIAHCMAQCAAVSGL